MADDSNLNTIFSTSMKAKLISSLLLFVSVVLLGVVAKLVMGMISKDEIGKMTNSIDSLVVTTGKRIQHIKGIVLALSENSEVLTQASKQSVTTIKEISEQIREINERYRSPGAWGEGNEPYDGTYGSKHWTDCGISEQTG
ncbi:hypothetical protein [Paenibacillus sp. 37]|uniref:hypothetical protein n=1 Tax=Paenibacillus sp. 37 TaxID=2607911 RepID=UPI00122E7D2E|nr:hypothetical protein [Paenibacillus sp. 37]